jgi:heptaprenyl diphosphate synthase component 2
MVGRASRSDAFYALVDADLAELERRLLDVGRAAHPVFRDAVAHLFQTPGKLLRPTLVFLAARFGRRSDREVVINLAESLELVHTASLVHDDVVDRAALRRNVPTVNAKWNDDIALIVGDYLFAKAYALAAVLPDPQVIAIVAQTVFALCDGELGEITAGRGLPGEQTYLDRIELKTASLYAACCQGAALLTEADPEHVASLGAFGTNLGMAFQITDDVLDLVGDETDFGKMVGRDLLEGMPTLPMIYAVAEQDGKGANLAARILAPAKTAADVRSLLDDIRRSSGPERARQRAFAFHDAAVRALAGLPDRAEREALREIADFVVSRVR